MLLDIGRLILGGLFLYFGAEWLIRGAAGLARSFGISALAVGLTVVAYGTSAPELVVSGLAAVEGKGEIALGNVLGSNIANVGLILGVTALISPPQVDRSLIRREVPVMLLASALLPLILWDDVIGRAEGLALFLGSVAFTVLVLRASKQASRALREEMSAEVAEGTGTGSRAKLAVLTVVGLAVLVAGGKVFVDGAVGLALALGMSERLVGLTIVAIGTSLPELAASLVAALRGHSSIAVGNVVGSNIFNILLILGVAPLFAPLTVSFATITVDLAVVGAFALFAAFALRGERKISRIEGGLFLGGYAAFLGQLILQG